ncbi:tetratricopeptide repeat protein [Chitinophaga silvatica]|uniref:tetratricopeptide repeat protein n=1 Tax=Chitinophaga silvatica TaxID=2282649 RepID=UPI0011C0E013|nr:hypothetical protein [Chitinophaga silvatica]
MKSCQLTTCICCIVFFTAICCTPVSGFFVEKHIPSRNYRTRIYVVKDSLELASQYQQLAHDLYSKGFFKKAIVQWKKVLDLQPCNAFAMFMLGKSYMGVGKFKKGTALCDQAVKL